MFKKLWKICSSTNYIWCSKIYCFSDSGYFIIGNSMVLQA